jgi:uncharacterized protein (DUF2267 family)
VNQTAEFANVLPPLLRALFLNDWNPSIKPVPFGSREALSEEVRSLRPVHNFSPANAIDAVAAALWDSVDRAALEKVLATLPPQAAEFWALPNQGQQECQNPS